MKKVFIILALLITIISPLGIRAQEADSTELLLQYLSSMDSIEKTLHYKTGEIKLGDDIATINVPENYKFLGPEEAKYVLTELWGNIEDELPLGLLFPEASSATNPSGYVFMLEYDPVGYVSDKDADKIDYDDLLKQIRKDQEEANKQRKELGKDQMFFVGWAAKPYYDKEKKILHWAKEYQVEDFGEHTLNYDIVVLGRKGVLTLEAISGISQLDSVNNDVDNILGMVRFNSGNQYADFDSKTDKVAAWTIGGLVAGKILAKAGFFAIILKYIKFIILTVAAAGGAIWRFITGRRKDDEQVVSYETGAQPDNTPIG